MTITTTLKHHLNLEKYQNMKLSKATSFLAAMTAASSVIGFTVQNQINRAPFLASSLQSRNVASLSSKLAPLKMSETAEKEETYE